MFARDKEPGYRDTDDRDLDDMEGDDVGTTMTVGRKSPNKNKKGNTRAPQGNRSGNQRSASNTGSKKRK
jgi:hypothetical protein